MTTKRDILAFLDELVTLTILDEGDPQAFRVRAYENARRAVEAGPPAIAEMTEPELIRLKGVGKSTASKIREFVETGSADKLDRLRKEYPAEFVRLTRVPGIGPKTAKKLRTELGIDNLEKLEAALEQEALRELPGFGPAKESKIAEALDKLGLRGKDVRFPIVEALPVATALREEIATIEGVTHVEICGSLRRFRETVADVDIIVAAEDSGPVNEWLAAVPIAAEILGHGDTKTSFVTSAQLQIDVRVVAPVQFGAAVQYFTGSKGHNIALRQLALNQGLTLNEYGLAELESGEMVAAATEEEIYEALGLQWIPPMLREGTSEIDLAASGELPRLVQPADIRGDLHDHTDRSGDGRATLEEMVRRAADRNLEYLAITDHGENLTINGIGRVEMLEQRAEIASLQEEFTQLRILHGCELNISVEGEVDYDSDFLQGFDWCVASVHDHFDLPAETQTLRLIRAMQNPAVHAIGHLSGRMIGRRPGIEFDVEAVLEAAALTGTALEINGALDRLDAAPEVIRAGIDLGVHYVISTDSHHPSEMRRMEWGVANAQRGWLTADRVINTWPLERLLAWIK